MQEWHTEVLIFAHTRLLKYERTVCAFVYAVLSSYIFATQMFLQMFVRHSSLFLGELVNEYKSPIFLQRIVLSLLRPRTL